MALVKCRARASYRGDSVLIADEQHKHWLVEERQKMVVETITTQPNQCGCLPTQPSALNLQKWIELAGRCVMAHFADIGVLVVAAIVSAALVLRFGVTGFVIGVVSVWALGILRIELLYRIDPQRDAAMLDAAWVAVLGWIVGVIWCAPFLAGRLLFRWRRRRQRHDNAA